MFWEQVTEISSDSFEGGIRVGFGGKIVAGKAKEDRKGSRWRARESILKDKGE